MKQKKSRDRKPTPWEIVPGGKKGWLLRWGGTSPINEEFETFEEAQTRRDALGLKKEGDQSSYNDKKG